jgi:hypothetical protein
MSSRNPRDVRRPNPGMGLGRSLGNAITAAGAGAVLDVTICSTTPAMTARYRSARCHGGGQGHSNSSRRILAGAAADAAAFPGVVIAASSARCEARRACSPSRLEQPSQTPGSGASRRARRTPIHVLDIAQPTAPRIDRPPSRTVVLAPTVRMGQIASIQRGKHVVAGRSDDRGRFLLRRFPAHAMMHPRLDGSRQGVERCQVRSGITLRASQRDC